MTHRHEWIEQPEARVDSETFRCAECEATSDLCHVCSGPSGGYGWICERCLEREQRVVRDVERYLGLWDERDRHREKSSAAMDLVTARSSSDGGITGPEDVLGILWSWIARWTEFVGAQNESPAEFLASRVMWAVHNPDASGWDDFPRAMRRARAAARSIVGLSPERMAQRCPRCAGTAVRDRETKPGVPCPDGLRDEVRCTGCGFFWPDEERFSLSARWAIRHIGDRNPNAFVTREQARALFPDVPATTWRQWISRRRLRSVDARFRVGDVYDLVQQWMTEARGGARERMTPG